MGFHKCILLLLMASSTSFADPCTEYKPLPDIHRRDPLYALSNGEQPINDRELVEDWYGNVSFKLVDEAPGFFKCGGFYPMWRNGSTGDNITICMETNSDNCSEAFQIEMKICNGYEVYYLRKAAVHRASYCFENNPDAPPSFKVQPFITVDLKHEEYISKLLFLCNFSRSTEDLFYKTIWYVEGAPVHVFAPAQWTEDYITNTTLTEDILMDKGFKAGITIHCAVRAQHNLDGGSSESELSQDKFVGVKIHHWGVYNLAEGEVRELFMAITVPFGCGTFLQSIGQKCYFNVEVVTLENPDDCTSAAVVENSCGIRPLEADSWQEMSYITFVGKITSMYGESSGVSHLKFKTPAKLYDLSDFWQDYDIGHVAITTTKNTSATMYKYCSMNNDPYLNTFDGNWLSLNDVGVYMLYEDESRNIEVQVETEFCSPEDLWWGSNPYCTCGIAVRAGRTVFEISHCDTPVWHIGYTACGDGGDVIIVRRNWGYYQITLPTGTIVDVWVNTLDVQFLNVYLNPTALDEGKSRALCGVLSDVAEDDWTMKNGTVTDIPQEFTDSWRIAKEESLFNPDVIENGFSSFKPVYQYCTCDESTPDKQITCSAMAASEVCINPAGMDQVEPRDCVIAKRKKRMATPNFRRFKRSTAENTWRNGWNESAATAHCESKFAESASVQMVKVVPGVDLESPMKACVADIKASGTDTFASAAVSSVTSQARREALVNPVLSQPDPYNPSAPSLYEVIIGYTCPGDCSGSGTCSAGKCQCGAGYGGGDCSVDLTTPPHLVLVADDGVCDMATDACLQIPAVGNIFTGSEDSKCLTEKHLVHSSGEKTYLKTTSSTSMFESISEVFCTLPELSEDEVVVSINISVSHAGDNYGNELSVLVYDSGCVSVNHNIETWTLQTGYCVFKGRCSAEGSVRSDNPCIKCIGDGPALSWQQVKENGCADGNLHLGESTGTSVSKPSIVLPSLLVLCHFLQKMF